MVEYEMVEYETGAFSLPDEGDSSRSSECERVTWTSAPSRPMRAEVASMLILDSIERDHSTKFRYHDTTKAPWLDDSYSWGTCRLRVAKVLLSGYTECLICLIIMLHFGLIIYETDQEAQCYPKFASNLVTCPTFYTNISWLGAANFVLLAIYSIEATVRIYVFRRRYFTSKLCVFEFLLCVGSWLALCINLDDTARISWLRLFRCCRLVYATKFAAHIRELQVLLDGFMSCMRAILSGMCIIVALFLFFSVFAVHLVHPINSQIEYNDCSRCPKGFQSISYAMLTLYQQIVAGDSWGMISIPIIEKSLMGLMLPFFQIVIGLGAVNLILASIVDQAMEARGKNRARIAQNKAADHKARKYQLLDLIRQMDVDGSGNLSRDEILEGIENNRELQTRIALAGLRQGELKKIVDALTSPETQTIGYNSFGNVIDDLDAAEIRTTVVLTKVMLTGMQRGMKEEFCKLNEKITTINRGIERLSDLHSAASPLGNTQGIHAQPHAENVTQRMSTSSAPWIPQQHTCPHATSTEDSDLRLEKSITDAFLSWRAELDSETSRQQQSLMQLDARWSVSLRELEETLLASAYSDESPRFYARFLDSTIRSHQILERRRHNLFENAMTAIEDDLDFWLFQCSFLGASGSMHSEPEPSPARGTTRNLTRNLSESNSISRQKIEDSILPRLLWL